MSTIASCPRCAQQVTIPGGAASSDTVRCPLCGAEYQLAEALAKAPPTLVVVSSLSVVAPEPPAENAAELHLFPAAESPYDFTDVGSGSNELPVDEIHGAPVETHSAPLDLHEAPLMAEVHGQDLSHPPADHFAAAEAEVLELPSDHRAGEAAAHTEHPPFTESLFGDSAEVSHEPAAHELVAHEPISEASEGDFLTSLDDHEPPAGASQAEIPAGDAHLPAELAQHELDLDAAESDWLGEEPATSEPSGIESSGIDIGGHVPASHAPHALGEAPAEQGAEELSFDGEEEPFAVEAGEPGFDTVNLDSGFEETRPIPEGVEGYSLDSGSAEEDEAHDEALAAITDGPARPARRKPSFIFSAIMYVVVLMVVLPGVYLAVMWGLKTDPFGLASMMPRMIVPAALNPQRELARGIPASQITPGPGDSDNAAPAGGAPSDPNASPTGGPGPGATPADENNASEENAPAGSGTADSADDNAPAEDNAPADAGMPAQRAARGPAAADPAADTGDTEEPEAADAAAMAADEATHDPDAGPGDADMPAADTADSGAAPADAADSDAAPADADMPADGDATADKDLPDSDLLGDSDAATPAKDADTDDAAPAEETAADEKDADKGADDKDADDKDADMPADSDVAADEKGDDMPADRDVAADDTPADSDAAAATAKDADADPDDADDDAPKKPAKASDDSAVGAALDEAMADENAADSAETVGPRDAVEYSPDDVNKALTEVASASKALDEASQALAGKEADKASKAELKKTKGQFYRKLYQLAEVATFTPSMAASAEAEQGSQQDLVGHTLVGSAASPGKFDEVGKAAAKWLEAVKGKEHQGIVLSGTLKSTAQRGKVFESQVLLTDGQQVVTVLSPAAPSVEPASAVLVWGTVAADPAEKIVGYEGDAKTAVWTTSVEAAPPGAAAKPAAKGASDAKAKIRRGTELARQGKIAEATAEFQAALALAPDSAEAHSDLADALAMQGKLDEAVAHYRRALEVDPTFALAARSLEQLSKGRHVSDESLGEFSRYSD